MIRAASEVEPGRDEVSQGLNACGLCDVSTCLHHALCLYVLWLQSHSEYNRIPITRRVSVLSSPPLKTQRSPLTTRALASSDDERTELTSETHVWHM